MTSEHGLTYEYSAASGSGVAVDSTTGAGLTCRARMVNNTLNTIPSVTNNATISITVSQ